MTIHYHGTPITPIRILETLAGKNFCVSFARPEQVKRVHQLGQSVMLDNGAFSFWKTEKPTDWNKYYKWIEPWLDCPTTWAVIPDVIDGAESENRRLAIECPFSREKMAPVWHLHESLDYLSFLVDAWPKICFGSSSQYSQVGSSIWHKRIGEAFNTVWDRKPWIHMLRGMRTVNYGCYPFGSVDSTDVARNHHAAANGDRLARLMADAWDSKQCPPRFTQQPNDEVLFDVENF